MRNGVPSIGKDEFGGVWNGNWNGNGRDKMRKSLLVAEQAFRGSVRDQFAVSETPSLRMLTIASTPREAFDFEL